MNCPHELVNFIIEYLKNRKCYTEMQHITSVLFDIEKGVPQGSCLGLILFLLFHCEIAQRIPSATHCHLFADDHALIIHASPWWHRTEFAPQMERIGQQVLNQVQAYAIEWKQPINFPKTEWQWTHRRVFIPTLSLSRSVNITSREQPCTNTLAITLMNVSHPVNIARGCYKKPRRTRESSDTLLDREHHQQEREKSSLKRSFNLICK